MQIYRTNHADLNTLKNQDPEKIQFSLSFFIFFYIISANKTITLTHNFLPKVRLCGLSDS
jgi:hypothetical protein